MSFLINPFAFAVAGGDFEAISSVTVGSGGAANIEFTSISTDWQHLQVRCVLRTENAAASNYPRLRFNGDTATNYALHNLKGNGSAASAVGYSNQSSIEVYQVAANNASASVFGVLVIDILDYASTSKNKTIRSIGGYDNNGSGEVHLTSGFWNSTSAVTSLLMFPGGSSVDFAEYSTAALFGVKAP